MDLPPTPFDACHKRPGRVSSLSLVRYKNTDYSVPVAYAHRDVVVRAYVDEVVIETGAEEIARHRRSYETEDFVFDPLHYLDLIERKVGALDQAAPLQGWDLGEEFARLRRLMEARLSQKNRRAAGKREFVQVLQLFKIFPDGVVRAAVHDALELGAMGVCRILCSGRSLSDGLKAFFEQNGELIFRLDLFSRGPFPILRRICPHEI